MTEKCCSSHQTSHRMQQPEHRDLSSLLSIDHHQSRSTLINSINCAPHLYNTLQIHYKKRTCVKLYKKSESCRFTIAWPSDAASLLKMRMVILLAPSDYATHL